MTTIPRSSTMITYGQVAFRVKNFGGVVPVDPETQQPKKIIPNTEYFQNHKRAFSLQISGGFKHAWTADDVLFGTFFEQPLTLPRGYSIALSLARRIDSRCCRIGQTRSIHVLPTHLCHELVSCSAVVVHCQHHGGCQAESTRPVRDHRGIWTQIRCPTETRTIAIAKMGIWGQAATIRAGHHGVVWNGTGKPPA